MKNLKNFSQLTESVNEGGKISIAEDVAAAFNDLNILNLLIDEGHFDQHGFPKSDIASVNECIDEAGLGTDFFKTEAEMDSYTNIVKASCQELISKL